MSDERQDIFAEPSLKFSSPSEGTLVVHFGGAWKNDGSLPPVDDVAAEISSASSLSRVAFDSTTLASWDSTFVIFLTKVKALSADKGIDFDEGGLPPGSRRLLTLSERGRSASEQSRRERKSPSLFSRIGASAAAAGKSTMETVTFLGETVAALSPLVRGRAPFPGSDLLIYTQECGVQSLAIVSLISFLVGMILAFVGAVQLALFGAEIYVADLVSLAMLRAMGAVMTGIVLAGRTGAAYAAQLGTMQVNEEIDALRTLGIAPVGYLVLPRVLALVLTMPLLCLYADFMGILGGALVGIAMFDIQTVEYFQQTKGAISMVHLGVGLFQSFVFAVLVGLAGCLRGMQCGRSAWEVGAAATSAVVTAIVWIITACALITMIFDHIGI